MSTTPPATVIEQPSRYQILVDEAVVGFTDYHDDGEQRTFPHTVIDEDQRGQGLASTLIREALEATRATGKSVIPQCPAVAGFIAKHSEYHDLVAADRRAEFGIS